MGLQQLLDLAGVDVLATADDHVFESALDAEVALGVHRGQIAGVVPALPVNDRGGGVGLVVVTLHDQVPARAQLAHRADGHGGTRHRVGDHDFRVAVALAAEEVVEADS